MAEESKMNAKEKRKRAKQKLDDRKEFKKNVTQKQELTKEEIRERKKRRNKRRKKSAKKYKARYWTTGKKIALSMCVLLLVCVIIAIAFVASKMSLINIVKLDPDKLSIYDNLEYDETGYLNVALFGLDTRANDPTMGSRSDTIMIASLNRETKEVKIISVYRDTLLQQEDGSYNKANAAYSFDGVEGAISLLNKNLDLDIQHYVTVDFAALVHVIDAVGGIEVDVTEEEIPYINGYAVEIIQNTGVDTWAVTEPGLQNLTGVQATAYARIRKTLGDDFKRTERQRDVLTKTAAKLQQADLGTLNTIIDKVFPMVETNFTLTEILAYAKDITKYWFGETTGFPFEKDTMNFENAGDSVIPWTLLSNVKELHQLLFPEMSYTPSYQVQEISSEIAYLSGRTRKDDDDSYSSGYEEDDVGDDSYDEYDSGYDDSGSYYNAEDTDSDDNY